MSDPHRDALLDKHGAIEGQILAEERRPMPDAVRLTDLKRQKLKVKDALAALVAPA